MDRKNKSYSLFLIFLATASLISSFLLRANSNLNIPSDDDISLYEVELLTKDDTNFKNTRNSDDSIYTNTFSPFEMVHSSAHILVVTKTAPSYDHSFATHTPVEIKEVIKSPYLSDGDIITIIEPSYIATWSNTFYSFDGYNLIDESSTYIVFLQSYNTDESYPITKYGNSYNLTSSTYGKFPTEHPKVLNISSDHLILYEDILKYDYLNFSDFYNDSNHYENYYYDVLEAINVLIK